ncbi:MAG: hypothetical protein LWW95_04845 [Candidatus Desulfofervidus auxilii]|nr:hypothetical protein [Candidatus Desulfofervidus auxilii]
MRFKGPIWLMQPIPYFGEKLNLKEWIWEPKIDGWRMQIIKYENNKIEFYGRRLETNPNWTKKLNYLINIANQFLPNYTLLDAELYSSGGRRFIPSLFAQQPKAEPIIFVFDIIFLEKEFLGNLPLLERRKLLKKIKFKKPFYIIKQNKIKELPIALKESLLQGNEGIVIKQIYSKYQISKDGPIATEWWRKIKK